MAKNLNGKRIVRCLDCLTEFFQHCQRKSWDGNPACNFWRMGPECPLPDWTEPEKPADPGGVKREEFAALEKRVAALESNLRASNEGCADITEDLDRRIKALEELTNLWQTNMNRNLIMVELDRIAHSSGADNKVALKPEVKDEWPEVEVYNVGHDFFIVGTPHLKKLTRPQAEAVVRAYQAMVELASRDDGRHVQHITDRQARRILRGEG